MTLNETLEALQTKVGEVAYTSDWLVIEQERIGLFADATNDHQWIHVDPPRANAESPYGAPIAHGYLGLSLMSYLRGLVDADTEQFPGVKNIINYGANKVRYPNAIRVGSRVRANFEVVSADLVKGDGIQLVERGSMEIEGQPKPACVAEIIMRLYF